MNQRNRESLQVYLALPSALLSKQRSRRRNNHLGGFQILLNGLRQEGFAVYCAYDACGWDPSRFDSAEASARIDWEQIQRCDHLVACPSIGEKISGGVHVETGWATALGKPVTLLVSGPLIDQSVVLRGLVDVHDVQLMHFEKDVMDVFEKLLARLRKAKPSTIVDFSGRSKGKNHE